MDLSGLSDDIPKVGPPFIRDSIIEYIAERAAKDPLPPPGGEIKFNRIFVPTQRLFPIRLARPAARGARPPMLATRKATVAGGGVVACEDLLMFWIT